MGEQYMTQGFLIMAKTQADQRAACACAYSIKNNNPDASVTMVVDSIINLNDDWAEPFDDVIEYPFGSYAPRWDQHTWQAWWATPYEYTIMLSPYSLVQRDMTSQFDYCMDHHNICLPTQIKNFRNEVMQFDDPRYGFYERYMLNPVYADFMYFDKSDFALDYFKLADPLIKNNRDTMLQIFEEQFVPDVYDNNIFHTVVVRFLDSFKDVTPVDKNILSFVDMDIVQYYLSQSHRQWTNYLNVWPGDHGEVKIQNYVVNDLLSYKEPEFLTEEILDAQRTTFRISN
jgi:hypothetical protein